MSSRSLTESLRETLALFDGPWEPRTTPELAARLDLGRRSTYERLERLVDHGRLETKKVGANARVWWRPPASSTVDRTDDTRDWPAVAESLIDDVLDGAAVGVFVLDENLDVAWINEAAERYFGLDRERVVGRDKRRLVEGRIARAVEDSAAFVDTVLATYDDNTHAERFECRVTAGDGPEARWLEHRSEPIETGAYAGGRVELYYDVTRQKGSERARREDRRRYDSLTEAVEEYRRWTRTLVENFPSGAAALVDEDFRYVTFAGTPEGDTDLTRAELEGRPVRDVLPQEIADVVVPGYEAALDGEPTEFEDTIDGRVYQFHFVPVRDDDGEVFAATAMSQDVTEREERERILRDAKLQLEAATEAGAVGTWEWQIPEDRLVAGSSFAETLGVGPDAAIEGVSLDTLVSAIHEDDRERVERQIEATVETCGEYEQEYRVRNADGEFRWVVARGRVACDDGTPVSFPGTLVDITERKERERELERQREHLAALDNLNAVVRDITDAVVDQSTREEIESIVCDRLADADSYEIAWIGDVDVATQTVNLRTEAGVEGYLDGITISVDPDDRRSEGPTGRALRTGEIQTTQDVRADARHDPWREHVDAHGVRSSAAIPIVHEGTTYGVLNVYAARPAAFEGQERTVISQLGEVVGHAIAATDRKQALMSDAVVELEFCIRDLFDAIGADVSTTETITIDHAVPLEDDEFLVYGRATADAVGSLDAIAEAVPAWRGLTVRSAGEGANFEARLSEPPVLSVAASLGGSVESTVIEDGDYRVTLHLAPGTDVRQVTDAVRATYPSAEVLKRRQITRREAAVGRVRDVLATDLTDRQRAALEAAFHAGFFEWPRDASGEDVATALDIAPSTFHQHLRKAQRQVFEALLSSPSPA